MLFSCYNLVMKNFIFDLYGTLIKIQTDELSPRFRAKMTARFSRLCGREVDFWSSYDRAFNQVASDEELDFISVIRQIADEHGALISEREARKFAALFRRKSTRKIGVYKGVKKNFKGLAQRRGAPISAVERSVLVYVKRD